MSPLFDITDFSKESTFKKVVYFKATAGIHNIRIIPEGNAKIWAHFIARTYVKCLGKDECPICQRNVKIRAEYPKDFRNHGYAGSSQRFCVNVLDKTPTKICSNCQEEVNPGINGRFPATCPKCSTIINQIKEAPINKIKLFSGGVELFGLLEGYNSSQLDEHGEPLGLQNFDIQLLCQMDASGKIKSTPIPMPHMHDPLEYNPEDLYDCSKSVVELSVKEIADLERGVALRDIYAARRSNAPEPTDTGSDDGDAKDAVNSLFNL